MSDKDNDIDRRLEQFTENPVARAFLQLLPGGSSIDAAISARVAQVQRVRLEWEHRRSEAALIDLIDWLNDLDQSKLDRGYMTSEQFADDFLEWYERAVHVSQS